MAPKIQSVPMAAQETPSSPKTAKPEPTPLADAFLWEHLGDGFLWKHLTNGKPSGVHPAPAELPSYQTRPTPAGMCDRASVQPLLENHEPFTGLVVLVGLSNNRVARSDHSAQPFIEGLLGPADFACRSGADEFLIVCPGLRGAEAQRRLNEISERLWNFQLRGQGSFSVLFSWGGIGVENEPLSEAIASATDRMQQTKRSRLLFFTRKAG
jgi:hypothetical protein